MFSGHDSMFIVTLFIAQDVSIVIHEVPNMWKFAERVFLIPVIPYAQDIKTLFDRCAILYNIIVDPIAIV